MLDKNLPIPLYLQLAENLKEKIHKMDDGDLFYSEAELKKMYQLSRPTIRHAIEYLVNNKYLYKEKGRGTFVSSKYLDPELNSFYSFSEFLKEKEMFNNDQIISFTTITSEKYAKKLDLAANAPIYQIKRLRLSNDHPVIFQILYVPVSLVPNLTAEMVQENGLYNCFRKFYNLEISKITDSFQVTYTNEEEAKHLKIMDHSAAMLIKRKAYVNDKPLEYTISIASANDFIFQLNLERKV